MADDVIKDLEEYEESPEGRYQYYRDELNASEKSLKKWRKLADKTVQKYLGKGSRSLNSDAQSEFRLNIFHSNVHTIGSMLYGQLPRIDVSRRYADSADDVGRVAAETMERLLNLDIEQNGKEVDCVLRSTLFDRLVPGLGVARVRYEADIQDGQLVSENAPVEYYFWGDVLWSWARNFSEVRWIAFRNYLTKDEVKERFGEKPAENIQYKRQQVSADDESSRDPDADDAWMKAEIWEIWDKQTRKVTWVCHGYDKALEQQDDPLKLQGFFPVPPFFLANPTTSLYAPTPDYALSQDLYNQIDVLQERIVVITEAVKVVGVYDSSADGVQRMFKEGFDNDLIPVDNWALFAEKGGIRGQVDWLPIVDIVNALDKLREMRSETIQLLQQVSGMADIMRGDLGNQYEGVGQTQIKAQFGSVRVQALQDQFAQFASDLFQLKAEIISTHFDPQTIAHMSNMQHSPDVELLQQAIELIKRPRDARLRITIRPESVAMQDYARLKSERTEYLTALSTFMQSSAPLMEADPHAKPFLLQLLQWGLAGFKGSSEIEGVIDRAVEASKKAAEEPQPDQGEQDAQRAQQLEKAKLDSQLQIIQAKTQAELQQREADRVADIQTAMAEHQTRMAEIEAGLQASVAEINAKMQAAVMQEQAQSATNVQQQNAAVQGEITKDALGTQMELEKESAKTAMKLQEIAAASSAKIREAKARPTTGKKSE